MFRVMVVIECPHCSEDIEMDDDAYGLFDCPYCDNEYEWGDAPKSKINRKRKIKPIQKKSTTVNRTRTDRKKSSNYSRNISGGGKNLLGGIQLLTFVVTIILAMVLLLGLNSESWYSVEYSQGDVDVERNYGSAAFTIKSYQDMEILDDEVERVSIGGSDYQSNVKLYEALLEASKEYCSDWEANSWGETEEEFDEECAVKFREHKKEIEWFSGWDSAGTLITATMIFGLILTLFALTIKTTGLLSDYKLVRLPEKLTNNYYKIDSMTNFILVSIVFLGGIMYRIAIPDIEVRFEDNFDDNDFSSGLGMIWWFMMVTVIIKFIILSAEVTLRKRSA
jgi:hypothetical protein